MCGKDRVINRLANIKSAYIHSIQHIDVIAVTASLDMQAGCLLIPQLASHMRKEVTNFILAYLAFIQLVADVISKCQNRIYIRNMFALCAKGIESVQKIGFKLCYSYNFLVTAKISASLLPSL